MNRRIVRSIKHLRTRRPDPANGASIAYTKRVVVLGEGTVQCATDSERHVMLNSDCADGVAMQVAKLREESERLANDQQKQGVLLISDVHHASAANYKAKADLLQANLAYQLAWAELERTIGRTPGEGTP